MPHPGNKPQIRKSVGKHSMYRDDNQHTKICHSVVMILQVLLTFMAATVLGAVETRGPSILKQPCQVDQNCNVHVNNSMCDQSRKLCECAPGFIESSNTQECLQVLTTKDGCKDSNQCLHFDNTLCQNGSCQCQSNYHLDKLTGSCVSTGLMPHHECVDDHDCKPSNHTSCMDGRCQCQPHYHLNKTLNMCVSTVPINGASHQDITTIMEVMAAIILIKILYWHH